MMRKLLGSLKLALVLFVFNFGLAKASDDPLPKKYIYPSIEMLRFKVMDLKDDEEFKFKPFENWSPLMTEVRSGSLEREVAVTKMKELVNLLKVFSESGDIGVYSESEWVFPVSGYDASSIGGVNGSGYRPGGFDFFTSGSGIHPAHDIFIRDRDQDCIDDITGKSVEILSMSGGIVVETRTGWSPEMDTRGGNFVYVFDNYTEGFFYYAHMKEVFVKVGEIVAPGSVLGTMGRTGLNAYPSRSPTHLHLMYVKSYEGDLQPEDVYQELLNSKITN